MRVPILFIVAVVCTVCAPGFAQYISFSGISEVNLPQTFDFGSNTVTVSQVSGPAVGIPSLIQYIPSPGTNGYDSPIGGVKQSILGTGEGPDSWELKFAFSQVEQITVHNTETYCNFEDTTLQSDNAWTQMQGSPNLVVNGLGTTSISLVGAYGAAGPFGYGYWSTTTSNLFMTYQLNETPGGSAGNGLEIAVPEPSMLGVVISAAAVGLMLRRRGRKMTAREVAPVVVPNTTVFR
jgi:hypothetical protein